MGMPTKIFDKKAFEKRLGNCYVLSGRYIMANHNATLVHGTINGFKTTGIDFDNPHAWIEYDGMVFDPVWDCELPKELYYDYMSAVKVNEYTYKEVAKLAFATEHWGTWE